MQSACALIYYLWPLWLHHIFRHPHVCFDFLYNFETFLILRRIRRDIAINVKTFSCRGTRYSCGILIKLEFSQQVFRKSSNIKFDKNQFSERRVVTCRSTDIVKRTAVFLIFRTRLKLIPGNATNACGE